MIYIEDFYLTYGQILQVGNNVLYCQIFSIFGWFGQGFAKVIKTLGSDNSDFALDIPNKGLILCNNLRYMGLI